MDPRDFFRGFFGIPPNDGGKPRGHGHPHFGDQEEVILPPGPGVDPRGVDLNRLFEEHMDHVFRSFGWGFNGMGAGQEGGHPPHPGGQFGFFPPPHPGPPPGMHPEEPQGSRDFMLAPGFELPGQENEDREVDLGEIAPIHPHEDGPHHPQHPPPGGFGGPHGFQGFFFGGIPGMGRDVFPGPMPSIEPDGQEEGAAHRSFFSFNSKRSVTLPDGTTETRETSRDSSGRSTETVTRVSPSGEVTREVVEGPPMKGGPERILPPVTKEEAREKVGVWGKNTTQSLFDKFFGKEEK